MKDKDAKLLEEAYDDLEKGKGQYKIRIEFIGPSKYQNLPGEEIEDSKDYKVSGSEAAYYIYSELNKMAAKMFSGGE